MEKNQLNAHIGNKLREIRNSKGFSLDETAERTGVSKPMLGQMERGVSNPTVGTLWKIADGLQVPFTTFVEVERPSAAKVSFDELKTLKGEQGGFQVKPVFSKGSHTPFEAFYVDLGPECRYDSNAHQEGVEEYIFMYHGEIQVAAGSETFLLKEGDALRFEADRDHGYINETKETARFMMIIYYS
ncbi:helix-turn-helix domain-containing protein [Salibacterium halotolerans]|uniref:Cupin domain-containing protein n=1 Tax=Salibacterium halotolerans TaxID=1884432 RepID=A0A1I5T6U9_9BACI|nr:XRE family transcriptional regulator [Salibacterium halotolerans]SFP78755.1 Cupin domain-containing protein [Salibacterium halotolerans]